MSLSRYLFAFFVLASASIAIAQESASFVPDPASVQRFGKGFRYPQAGWIVLHLEGAPYERGVQHGRLLAPEIAAYLRCYAAMQSPSAPTEGWKLTRTMADTIFLRGFDREFLDEMQGIADGAAGAGARFDGRAIDLLDIVTLNLWAELMTLDSANAATPTGLEGVRFPEIAPSRPTVKHEGHCSAFAATGKATRDGHALIGHITMFGLYASDFYNVWIDVRPEKGHRLVMQSYPAGIYSGMDYYLNDAGIAMVETTIDQTRFERTGRPLASRARQALQYGESIDDVVKILKEGNNGLYNNEWLLADMKTDEIAMYELGTNAGKLWRSGRNEWFGGTEGFYWGCNNPKDLAVRLETIPATNDRPANMVWFPADRDMKWIGLYRAHTGKMDEQFAKTAFTTAPLCSSEALDAKFTSAAMAKKMQSWCIFGPPLGRTWMPTPEESRKYKEVRPLVSNSWTLLGPAASPAGPGKPAPVDMHDPASDRLIAAVDVRKDKDDKSEKDEDDEPSAPSRPAWHGTILPATDGDLWLASSFAEYERIMSRERGYVARRPDKCLCEADYDKLAPSLFAARARYFAGVRTGGDSPLSRVRWDAGREDWYKIAGGKGILVLAELRRLMGDESFVKMMDDFGRAHAGQKVSTSEFASQASKAAGRDLATFFKYWTDDRGLPRYAIDSVECQSHASSQPSEDEGAWGLVHGVLRVTDGPMPASIDVTFESADSEETQTVDVSAEGKFDAISDKPARRMVVDKYARLARANGGQADLGSFADDILRTLIIYGTREDRDANREAADVCQKAIRTAWYNVDVPIKRDADCTEADLKKHHLILIGRPTTNTVTQRFAAGVAVMFGPASLRTRNETYGHSDSAVLAAGINSLDPQYSVCILAGNSAAATFAHAGDVVMRDRGVEIRVFDPSGKATSMVAPAPELVWEFTSGNGRISQAESKMRPLGSRTLKSEPRP